MISRLYIVWCLFPVHLVFFFFVFFRFFLFWWTPIISHDDSHLLPYFLFFFSLAFGRNAFSFRYRNIKKKKKKTYRNGTKNNQTKTWRDIYKSGSWLVQRGLAPVNQQPSGSLMLREKIKTLANVFMGSWFSLSLPPIIHLPIPTPKIVIRHRVGNENS